MRKSEYEPAMLAVMGFTKQCHRNRRAFTVVELLVTLAIIGLLLALLLPAIQNAREAARRTACRNNLKQIGTACMQFESSHGTLPGNGWGFAWLPEVSRGAGKKQPGGWIFQILPEIGQQNVWSFATTNNRGHLAELRIPGFKCPTRPSPIVSGQTDVFTYTNGKTPRAVAKTDYAINEGDFITQTPGGPQSLPEGDNPNFRWKDVSAATGVSWLREGARIAMITDGTSNTYLVGEKYISVGGYDSAADSGHDQSMLSGVDLDTTRWTLQTPLHDTLIHSVRSFGSAHANACFMAFCDGSVRAVSYSIDARVHRVQGSRNDGEAIN